jgi:phage terminase large subunit-like protein
MAWSWTSGRRTSSRRRWASVRWAVGDSPSGCGVPRQNGKGALIEARELAGLLVFGEQSIIHSAHEQKTARVGFDRIRAYFDNYDDLRKRVKQVGTALNREYIELRSGQTLRFPARSKGAIRGFSIDCLMLDEAQILGDSAWQAIQPTISARPNPQTWLLGTPPTPLDDGAVFERMRRAGLEGKDHRLCWCEWSAPEKADLDNVDVWAQANPALGHRISVDAVGRITRIRRRRCWTRSRWRWMWPR